MPRAPSFSQLRLPPFQLTSPNESLIYHLDQVTPRDSVRSSSPQTNVKQLPAGDTALIANGRGVTSSLDDLSDRASGESFDGCSAVGAFLPGSLPGSRPIASAPLRYGIRHDLFGLFPLFCLR